MEHELLAVKLIELKREYGLLQGRIRVFQNGQQTDVREEIKRVKQDCAENALLLQNGVETSRSKTVASLAAAQDEYGKKVNSALREALRNAQKAAIQETASQELMALYAEYAIDFATQATRHALLAALHALDLQMEKENERSQTHE